MEPSNESTAKTAASSGFLLAVRSSAILSERQLQKVEQNVAVGEYPPEPAELADRLVKEQVLTPFQARQLLKGRYQGLVIGRYVILDFIGMGAMGRVYKAWHKMMGRVVALKILNPKYVTRTRSLARFQREMQLVGRLDHPNVVRAFDADRIGDVCFIAMEYAEGQTLADLLGERGALSPVDVVDFASQVAEGLAHAHTRGVLHRDIKPSNLMLTGDRKIKILDFGLATLLEREDLPAELTAAGITVGTPDYISPEQARMVKLDGRSDLYSLGCAMYVLISGKLPFQGQSSMDCVISRITGKAPPLHEVRPGLPPRLVQTIEKLMATSPEDRYQTADEAAVALRSLLRPKGSSAGRPTPTAPTPEANEPEIKTFDESPPPPQIVRTGSRTSQRDRHRLRSVQVKAPLVAAAIAVVALIGVGAYLLTSSEGNPPAPGTVATPTPSRSSPATPPVQADAPRVRLVIETPKDGATVGPREELTCRLESEGWPVIYIQSLVHGQPWWCQAPVAKLDGGRFGVQVVFGDELTPKGTRFRIAAVVARTREEAQKFQIGTKVSDLPEGLPRSDEVVVALR